MDAFQARLEARVDEWKAALLAAIEVWPESTERRFSALENADAAILARLSLLEGRVAKVEQRLDFPSQ